MARHAPALSPSELQRMTPEESRYLERRVTDELKREADLRLVYVQGIIKAMPRGLF